MTTRIDEAIESTTHVSPDRLLRIQEVAAETGLTTRAIRYYEEVGLLRPAARSGGDYRLYDASDLERLGYIKNLRDVAGFSLGEIGDLLEDEDVRSRNRAAYRATDDPSERRRLLAESLARIDHQAATLRSKLALLQAMVEETDARRARVAEKLRDEGTAAEPAGTAPPARRR
jgi:DNA-binding transcriptional MerR regulator